MSVYFYLLTIVPGRQRTNARGIETVTNNWRPTEENIKQTNMSLRESPEYLGDVAPLGLALYEVVRDFLDSIESPSLMTRPFLIEKERSL